MKAISIVLIIGGVLLLIFGIYQFVEFQQSFGGKAASIGNQLSKAFGGSTRVARGYVQPIIMIVGGIVAGAAGLILYKKN